MNHPAPLWEVTPDEFARLMDVNVDGTVNVIRALVPAMIAAGRGVIANLSSGWGRSTSPEVAPDRSNGPAKTHVFVLIGTSPPVPGDALPCAAHQML